jgi:hypothetical protein
MSKNYSSNRYLPQPFLTTGKTNMEPNPWPHFFVKLAKLEVTNEVKGRRKNPCFAVRDEVFVMA